MNCRMCPHGRGESLSPPPPLVVLFLSLSTSPTKLYSSTLSPSTKATALLANLLSQFPSFLTPSPNLSLLVGDVRRVLRCGGHEGAHWRRSLLIGDVKVLAARWRHSPHHHDGCFVGDVKVPSRGGAGGGLGASGASLWRKRWINGWIDGRRRRECNGRQREMVEDMKESVELLADEVEEGTVEEGGGGPRQLRL